MFHRFLQVASVAVCLLLVVPPPELNSTVPVEDSRWHDDRLQSISVSDGSDLGGYPSIAIDPVSQDVYISYYNAQQQNLMLANRATPGTGNCGKSLGWYCGIIDSDGMVGPYSSIDVFNNGSNLRIGIAYHDMGNERLKYAQKSASLALIQPLASWAIQIIDFGSAGVVAGKYASLKYGQDGRARIAYTEEGSGNGNLLFASQLMAGTGNCGPSNTWQCDTIDVGSNVAYVSLDLDSFDVPAIAYYDRTAQSLKLALGNQSGGNCGPGNTWRCYVIDDNATDDIGKYASLAVSDDPNVPFHIAYLNATTGQLRYAYSNTSSPNCGGGLPFRCIDIEAMDANAVTPVQDPAGISIALDGTSPVIAYTRFGLLTIDLKMARPAFSLKMLAGNCGPSGTFGHTWVCSYIERGYEQFMPGSPGMNVGEYTDMALMQNGLAAVVYTGCFTDDSECSLYFSNQLLPLFLPLVRR